MDDDTYLGALERMFEQAMKAMIALPPSQQGPLCARLEVVRDRSQAIGCGVGGNMAALFAVHRAALA